VLADQSEKGTGDEQAFALKNRPGAPRGFIETAERDLGLERSLDAQTPRPSAKDEAVPSRVVSKVRKNAATEGVEKAPPERRSHRSRHGQIGKPFCPDGFERSAGEDI
jgi:hypothetical protein